MRRWDHIDYKSQRQNGGDNTTVKLLRCAIVLNTAIQIVSCELEGKERNTVTEHGIMQQLQIEQIKLNMHHNIFVCDQVSSLHCPRGTKPNRQGSFEYSK